MTTTILQPSSIGATLGTVDPDLNYDHQYSIGRFLGNISGNTWRWLLKFNGLSDGTIPAGDVIHSAVLSIHEYVEYSTNARTCRVFRQKRAWVPAECTWNIYATGNNWQSAGGFGADDCEQDDIGSRAFSDSESVPEFKDFALDAAAIKEIVAGTWQNNGFLLKFDTENSDGGLFHTHVHTTASERPKLVVVHAPPPIPRVSVF